MPRLFVALTMPPEIAAELERLCVGLPATRWGDPEQFHLTLRFVGEVDHGTFMEIGAALGEVSHPPFALRLKGIGHFPPRGAPQALWAGIEDAAELGSLRRRVGRVLADLGLPRERRNFEPHVTLGRFRAPPPEGRFGSWLAGRALFRSSPFYVSSFALFSSQLRPEGPLHALEAEYDFVTGVMERA